MLVYLCSTLTNAQWFTFLASSQLNEKPVGSENDWVYIHSHQSKRTSMEMISSFTKGNPDREQMTTRPQFMLANARSILTGINLPPADGMTILDGDFKPQDTKQLSTRTSRNYKVQKAACTECYVYSLETPECYFGKWLNQNMKTKAELADLVAAGEETLELAKQGARTEADVATASAA